MLLLLVGQRVRTLPATWRLMLLLLWLLLLLLLLLLHGCGCNLQK